MQKIKLGILGCGGAALSIHLPILSRLYDSYELTAICDQFPERAEQTAQKYGIRKMFSSFEKMLDEPFEMLVILTLNHEYPIEKGLEAGKHIFTEKPISLDLDRAHALKQKADRSGLGFYVGLMRCHDPLIRKLRQEVGIDEIDSGFFYKYDGSDALFRKLLFPPQMEVYTFHTAEAPLLPVGFNEVQLFALKTLLWSGIHQLSAMLFLFEELEPVTCCVNKDFSSLSCSFETPKGKHFVLQIGSTQLPIYEEKIFLFGKSHKTELSFSSPYLNLSQAFLSLLREENQTINSQHFHSYETAFQKMWTDIYNSMATGNQEFPIFALKVETLAKKAAEIATFMRNP